MKLAVCYPGDMSSVFMAAFQSIVNIEAPVGYEVKWFRGVGWCQARRRTDACEKALAWGADLICQLDVDQVYEPDILKRLIARHDEGYRVIAAMVPGRQFVKASKMQPFQKLAWRSTEDGKSFEPVTKADGEVVRCEFPTSACVLFPAQVLRDMQRPWYSFGYDPKTWRIKTGEDGSFFVRLARMGVPAYVDTTLEVGHCHVFNIDESFPERFADWAEDGAGEPEICRYD